MWSARKPKIYGTISRMLIIWASVIRDLFDLVDKLRAELSKMRDEMESKCTTSGNVRRWSGRSLLPRRRHVLRPLWRSRRRLVDERVARPIGSGLDGDKVGRGAPSVCQDGTRGFVAQHQCYPETAKAAHVAEQKRANTRESAALASKGAHRVRAGEGSRARA